MWVYKQVTATSSNLNWSRRAANYPGCFLIDNGGRDVLLTQLMLTLGPDAINRLYISLFLPNIQTSLWLQLSFSLTTCWYFTALTSVWDISKDLLINFYCWRLELEHLDSKCTSKQNEFENLLLWHFKKPCVFFARVVNMEKPKKNFFINAEKKIVNILLIQDTKGHYLKGRVGKPWI